MNRYKIIFPVIVMIISLAFVLVDSADMTVEDAISMQGGPGSTAPVKTMIGCVEDGEVSIY